MKRAGLALGLVLAAVALACAGEPLRGPEAWLNMVGGNVRKDGLRCDLESLKAAGFSGIQFFHIGRKAETWPGCEDQIPCLSEKWDDLIAYLGSECGRLGLNLTVQNCPGWSQSGGPWISATNAMRDVKMARQDFLGGEKPFLPEIPREFRDADSDWRDIAVLAFPTPLGDESGNDRIFPVSVATNGLNRVFTFDRPVTVRTIKLPGLVNFIEAYAYHAPWMHVRLEAVADDGTVMTALDTDLPVYCWRDYVQTISLACDEATARTWRYAFSHRYPIERYFEPTFHTAARSMDWEAMSGRVLRSIMRKASPRQSPTAWVKGDSIVDLTDRRGSDGSLDWTPPAGRWTLLRIGHVNSKRVNAPAPKEATGWECDKLAPEGIEAHFNGYIRKLAEGPLKGVIKGMLVDSWECWCQTWTPRMERYFREANGYELRLKLPMLFGWVVDSPEETARFLNDWRRTIGDLITRNYYGKMAELAHAAGLKAYYESAFGDIVCGDLLEYWKHADDPMCEFWQPYAPREVGHVGSEAFKSFRPCVSAAHVYGRRRVVAEAFTEWGLSWKEDFRLLRDAANRAFAKGVTHLAYQSCTHAPVPDALPPGGCMNGSNGTPFTRLQTWWRHMPEFNGWVTRCEERLERGRPVADVLWYLGDAADHKPDDYFAFPEGFRADYLNRDVLLNRLSLKDGLFAIPEGTAWRVLWVPDTLYMRPDTKARLDQLAAAGGTVVFGDKDALVRALAGLQKDVATSPSLGDGPSDDFMWLHRQDGAADRYFVVAGTNGFRGGVTFRAKGPVSVYDPVTEERTAWQNGTELVLGPSQSVFVEFDPSVASSAVPRGINEILRASSPSLLSSPWKLSFAPGWDAPETVTLDELVPWCEIPGFSAAARAYSGTVVYETAFELPTAGSRPQTLLLDLGRVETIAEVWVNGRKVRTLWCEPYACDVSRFVRPGRNELRIEVTGVWRNRVVYDQNQPEDSRKTWILFRRKYNPPLDAPLLPQGLLGPVAIRVAGGEEDAPAKVGREDGRPSPSPALLKRIESGFERYGIVHFSVNTYTDREWGYGNENPSVFNPPSFDADQIVHACKAGGLQGLIIVTKHHDGFCLWPTKTTSHNISRSPFRGGKGDYVKEMQMACERHGLRFGVYLSLWDRNDAEYGSPAYRERLRGQLLELFSGHYGRPFELWFDGANGGDGYYGGACELRKVPGNYYRMAELIDEVRAINPDLCVFYDWDEGELHYPFNESGDLSPECRASFPTRAQKPTPGWENCLYKGDVNGRLFKQPECDFPLRPGWFYHAEQDGCTRSPEFLMKIYLRTCGNGGTMNVGIAPDRRGLMTDEDMRALRGFDGIRRRFFSRKVAPEEGFNVIVMREDVSRGEHVDGWEFVLDGRVLASGPSLGIKRIRVLKDIVKGVRAELRVTRSTGTVGTVSYELYRADPALVAAVLASSAPAAPTPKFADVGAPTLKTDRSQAYMFWKARTFSAVTITPDKANLGGTPVEFRLSFSDDGEAWRSAETVYRMDNVAANPIPQRIALGRTVKAKYLRIESLRALEDGAVLSDLGLSVVSDK